MIKLTFCCNCNKVFETNANLYNPDPNDSIDSVTCPFCGYWLIVSNNTKMFDENCNKNMNWSEFLRYGIDKS